MLLLSKKLALSTVVNVNSQNTQAYCLTSTQLAENMHVFIIGHCQEVFSSDKITCTSMECMCSTAHSNEHKN